MEFKTHTVFSLLIALLYMNYYHIEMSIAFIFWCVLGGMIPDIDHPKSKINNTLQITKIFPYFVSHRGIFHSLLGAGVLYLISLPFFSSLIQTALLLGFFSHIVLDSLTKDGISYLHPLPYIHIRGPIYTGSFLETLFFIVCFVYTAFLLAPYLI